METGHVQFDGKSLYKACTCTIVKLWENDENTLSVYNTLTL